MKKYDVLDIGIIVADIPVKIPYPVLDFTQDTVRVEKIDILPGGDAANSAITLSRLGKKTALAGALGEDAMGRLVKELIGAQGVDVGPVHMKKGVKTSASVVLVNSRADRSFICAKGNNATLCAADLNISLLRETRHVNLSSLFAHPLLEKEGGEDFFKRAKEAGVTVSADAGHDHYGTGFEGVAPLLQWVDLFLPSYEEAKYMSGESEPARMAKFFVDQTGEKTVVIKLGGQGCYVSDKGKGYLVPSFRVKAVDTTGAGDNFLAGFLSAYLDGAPVRDCARFACACAALSTLYLGATSSYVDIKGIQNLMKRDDRPLDI